MDDIKPLFVLGHLGRMRYSNGRRGFRDVGRRGFCVEDKGKRRCWVIGRWSRVHFNEETGVGVYSILKLSGVIEIWVIAIARTLR